MKAHSWFFLFLLMFLATLAALPAAGQDWIRTGSNLGSQRIRLAAANFKPVGGDPQTQTLKTAFDATLSSDLASAGIFG